VATSDVMFIQNFISQLNGPKVEKGTSTDSVVLSEAYFPSLRQESRLQMITKLNEY
jgi:hypothetical protein